MNLEELRAVQADERSADGLQALPDSFYQDVADYLERLRNERERVANQADDPFESEQVQQLSDEIGTVEEVTEAIYERRIGKVMKQASLTASGVLADEEGLTVEEAALFHDLVSVIKSNRDDVLSILQPEQSAITRNDSPEDSVTTTEDQSTTEESSNETPPSEDVSRGEHSESESSTIRDNPTRPDHGNVDRMTVRITKDVGEIYGVDERTYELTKDDVVDLPKDNATALLSRDAADKLE